MPLEVVLPTKRLLTDATHKEPFTSVDPYMLYEIAPTFALVITEPALEGLFTLMISLMLFQIAGGTE